MENDMNVQLLGKVVIEILEDAAFIFAEPIENSQPPSEDVYLARLSFKGPSTGQMVFSASSDLAIELAANLLGIDADDPDAQEKASDAIGEILNIIGGALLQEWFGTEADFEMGVPEVLVVPPDNYSNHTNGATWFLPLMTEEGERVDAAILK